MNTKLELIQSHITEMVAKLLKDNIVDYNTIADTNAIIALDRIKKIIADDSLSDFDAIEEIVCVLEENNIDCGSRHDFWNIVLYFLHFNDIILKTGVLEEWKTCQKEIKQLV